MCLLDKKSKEKIFFFFEKNSKSKEKDFQNGLPLDIDLYDLAEWCSVIELSRISRENNNAPIEVPDFTRGYWNIEKGYKHAFVK